MQNFLGSLRSPTLLYWYFQTVVNLKLFNDFLYIFPYLPNNIYTCRHQCINWTPSFHISWLSNYTYINIWRNCYHLANLHSGHVGCTHAAIAYIVYIGKNYLKLNTGLVHVQTQEAHITIYSVCPRRSNRPKFSVIDTKFGVLFTDKFPKRSWLFITL